METSFTLEQLADPDMRESEKILRACVHCGFCTATCPTYVLLGDELDSPRGRIYLLKEMLEKNVPASDDVVTHIDRCLSCLSCMTTCPSGVNYMHLVDHGRRHIEETYTRPLTDRIVRWLLAFVLPRPSVFRKLIAFGSVARPIESLLPRRLRGMLELLPKTSSIASLKSERVFPAQGIRRKRVALLTGCVQQVIAPEINDATVRLLTRHGCEVIVASGSGCCGALSHHLGREADNWIKANVDAWSLLVENEELDAVVVNASGCGTMVKDYGFLLRDESLYAEKAQHISAITQDVSELLISLGLKEPVMAMGQRVAYQNPCSMQHGQKVSAEPKALLAKAGFDVLDVPEGHLCCGSAGTYNILQPELAAQLRDRKVGNITTLHPDIIASGNIGCMVQIGSGTEIPIVHTVELLDWATGGIKPAALR
jgi:glycolate oxidase iron-sulfur subunit